MALRCAVGGFSFNFWALVGGKVDRSGVCEVGSSEVLWVICSILTIMSRV